MFNVVAVLGIKMGRGEQIWIAEIIRGANKICRAVSWIEKIGSPFWRWVRK